uniref:Uncharacterized protein n=1 Tax=Zea mays TaxID=4577 RepID=A0A804N8E4_MAIZE
MDLDPATDGRLPVLRGQCHGGGRVTPDAELLSCLVSCYRRASALLPAHTAHAYRIKNVAALAFYASVGPALVALYASRGKVGAARRVFGYMDGWDVVSWNVVLGRLWLVRRGRRPRGIWGRRTRAG